MGSTHSEMQSRAVSYALLPRIEKITEATNRPVAQLQIVNRIASRLQSFLRGLKDAIAMIPPNAMLNEKKIWQAASSHTCGSRSFSNYTTTIDCDQSNTIFSGIKYNFELWIVFFKLINQNIDILSKRLGWCLLKTTLSHKMWNNWRNVYQPIISFSWQFPLIIFFFNRLHKFMNKPNFLSYE